MDRARHFLLPLQIALALLSGITSAQAQSLVWAKSFPATASSVAVDKFGSVYIAGSFGGTLDFDPGPGTYTLSSAGASDMFVAKFSKEGDLLWARRFGGLRGDGAGDVAVDQDGNAYVTGNTRVFDQTRRPGNFYELVIVKHRPGWAHGMDQESSEGHQWKYCR
jgi:hypothetical protein